MMYKTLREMPTHWVRYECLEPGCLFTHTPKQKLGHITRIVADDRYEIVWGDDLTTIETVPVYHKDQFQIYWTYVTVTPTSGTAWRTSKHVRRTEEEGR